jgi:hypothetical protein
VHIDMADLALPGGARSVSGIAHDHVDRSESCERPIDDRPDFREFRQVEHRASKNGPGSPGEVIDSRRRPDGP